MESRLNQTLDHFVLTLPTFTNLATFVLSGNDYVKIFITFLIKIILAYFFLKNYTFFYIKLEKIWKALELTGIVPHNK